MAALPEWFTPQCSPERLSDSYVWAPRREAYVLLYPPLCGDDVTEAQAARMIRDGADVNALVCGGGFVIDAAGVPALRAIAKSGRAVRTAPSPWGGGLSEAGDTGDTDRAALLVALGRDLDRPDDGDTFESEYRKHHPDADAVMAALRAVAVAPGCRPGDPGARVVDPAWLREA